MSGKVIIFGSSGFIGSALCRKFSSEGYLVHGCDIFDNNPENKVHFHSHDLLHTSPDELFELEFDYCINCAGSASVPFSFQSPFNDYELNTRIVFTILNELWKRGYKTRFVNLSSAAVYGNPSTLPVKEDTTLRPISPYGNHKLMSEMIVNQFRDYFKMEATSLRIFSAYGPGLRKQVFWDIYQKALSSSEIIMFGTGDESRDFIFVEDLCKAVYLIATSKELYPVYNIGNGNEVKIKDVVGIFCECFGNLSYKFNGEWRAGDPANWSADISKIKSLGYEPLFSIEEGIEKTVNWLKTQK